MPARRGGKGHLRDRRTRSGRGFQPSFSAACKATMMAAASRVGTGWGWFNAASTMTLMAFMAFMAFSAFLPPIQPVFSRTGGFVFRQPG